MGKMWLGDTSHMSHVFAGFKNMTKGKVKTCLLSMGMQWNQIKLENGREDTVSQHEEDYLMRVAL